MTHVLWTADVWKLLGLCKLVFISLYLEKIFLNHSILDLKIVSGMLFSHYNNLEQKVTCFFKALAKYQQLGLSEIYIITKI